MATSDQKAGPGLWADLKRRSYLSAFKRAGRGARIVDGVLGLVFIGLALNSGWWVWWFSAALCLVTVVTSPIERVVAWLSTNVVKIKKSR